MSQLRELRVGTARTINLGNFENLRVEASLTVTVDDGDDIAAVRAKAQQQLREVMEETYLAQNKKAQDVRPW